MPARLYEPVMTRFLPPTPAPLRHLRPLRARRGLCSPTVVSNPQPGRVTRIRKGAHVGAQREIARARYRT
jgi:hypothetical protein